MIMKQLLFIVLFMMSFVSCSSEKKYVIDKYSSRSVKFEKEEIVETNGNYSLTIPKNWSFGSIPPRYSEVIFEHSFVSENNKNIISIHKVELGDVDLKEFNESSVRFTEELIPLNIEKITVVDYGETDVLKYPAYFSHISRYYKVTFETITFIMKSREEGVFYRLTIEGEEENMSMMLQCLKSFEILK